MDGSDSFPSPVRIPVTGACECVPVTGAYECAADCVNDYFHQARDCFRMAVWQAAQDGAAARLDDGRQ